MHRDGMQQRGVIMSGGGLNYREAISRARKNGYVTVIRMGGFTELYK